MFVSPIYESSQSLIHIPPTALLCYDLWSHKSLEFTDTLTAVGWCL